MSDIEIEIDGKPLKAKPNQMVIQVADEAGIYIPRFCYHKHLTVAANCRMCLVEVEKSPKPLPACATPVSPGMKVYTRSKLALSAQKAVMEFLLINHPLDCPICDQGGECELQDLSLGYGSADSYYKEGKRAVKDENLGPLIATEMTRCIHCTRCVRFGDEIAGLRELGATGRGEHMEIGTYVKKAMRSPVSGNIIDLCPVGALTSKPFRFKARAWELTQHPSIAPHDCLGSHVNVHTRNGKVMRIVPRENPSLNQTWISDRDRFSYEGLYHPDRLSHPIIREGDQWKPIEWSTALDFVLQQLHDIKKSHGADAIAALASPQSTVEELYLLQKWMRQLGTPHLDHRVSQTDFREQSQEPLFPGFPGDLDAIEHADVIFLVGTQIHKEQPILSLRIRNAVKNGAKVICLNMVDAPLTFSVAAKHIVAPHQFTTVLSDILLAISSGEPHSRMTDQACVELLKSSKNPIILLGALALQHPQASRIKCLARALAQRQKGSIGTLTEGPNAAGAWIAGVLPHRGPAGQPLTAGGHHATDILTHPKKAYVLFNLEPDLECANPVTASRALEEADCVIAFSAYKNPLLEQCAHIILPIAPWTETSGTWVNMTGTWQSFEGVAKPYEQSRPGWKVLRALGSLFQFAGFDYESSTDVRDEVQSLVNPTPVIRPEITEHHEHSSDASAASCRLSRIGDVPIYATDSITRRSGALQSAQSLIEGDITAIHLHPATADAHGVKHGERVIVEQNTQRLTLTVTLDTHIPLDAALIMAGIPETATLGERFGSITLHKLERVS